jgi:DNA-binding NarL/FixJ family response regulator
VTVAFDAPFTSAKRGASTVMLEKPTLQLLVVDNSTYRLGLRSFLDVHAGVTVVAETDNGRAALGLAADLKPDVLVMDIALPDLSGVDVCRQVTTQIRTTHVVLTSAYDWDVLLAAAWDAGADAFLLRSMSTEALVRSILLAGAGQIYTTAQITRVRAWGRGVGGQLRSLSSREWGIFREVAAGRTNREISVDLNIAEHTVEKHLSALLQKFQVGSRTALLALILRYHLDQLTGIGQIAGNFPLQMTDFHQHVVTEIRHPTVTEIRHSTVTETRHVGMADFRDDSPLSSL